MNRKLVKFLFPFGELYWFLFRPKTYGVKCVVRHDGKFLFIRNSYGSGAWTFPGGGVKRGETPEDAVRREVFEEVGIVVKNLKEIGQFVSAKEYKRDTVTVFMDECEDGRITLDPTEIAEARWFERSHLPAMSGNARLIMAMVK